MITDASRPASVQRAVLCLWISCGLALLVTLAQVAGVIEATGATVGMTAAIGIVTAGLLALMAANINAGRGWARWLFLVFYVIGTLLSVALVLVLPAMFRALPVILQLNAVAQILLQSAALVFMLTTTSRLWFKSKHPGAAPQP